ncbi:hypothetical protein EI200_18220 [Peribacillus simplex]|uniref:hypothetical protein n=1 Tax=Peribacillus simplex TaxID=1478 RepID=UPI000F6321AF|nr:hypothetical protein [Peribacillus simplex]RRN68831.1 hypothetical protein EI200_18220 [Peribacillus simplex]
MSKYVRIVRAVRIYNAYGGTRPYTATQGDVERRIFDIRTLGRYRLAYGLYGATGLCISNKKRVWGFIMVLYDTAIRPVTSSDLIESLSCTIACPHQVRLNA